MKRKGRIILVTMLAVLFMAGTVYAKGGSWYDHGIKQLWKQVCKLEKKVAKADYRSKISLHKAKKNAREIRKLKHSKRKGHRWGKKPGLDLDALKAELLAELKADEAFKAELRGEKGDPGDQGPEGPPGPNVTVVGRWLQLTNWDPNNPVKMNGAQLPEAFIPESYMLYTELAGANLKGAHLNDSDFTGADFTDADLRNAKVVGCWFTDANFTGANLKGVNMASANGYAGATWSDTICPDGSNSDDNGLSCEGHMQPSP